MTAALSQDLRARLLAAVEAGSSRRQAALRFAVSPSAVIKLVQRVHQTGTLAPARIGGYRRPLLEAHEARLRALLAATPDMTLAEIRAELMRHEGVEVSLSTIHTTLARLGLRRKKLERQGLLSVEGWGDTRPGGDDGTQASPTTAAAGAHAGQRAA